MTADTMAKFLTRSALEAKAREALAFSSIMCYPVEPIAVAKAYKVDVRVASFSLPNICGVLRMNGGKPQILVNRRDPSVRQRFTIAHELGHFVLDHSTDPDFVDSDVDVLYRISGDSEDKPSDKRMEIQANHFAAGLLMPAEWVREAMVKTTGIHALAELFVVSPEAMRIRLANLPTREWSACQTLAVAMSSRTRATPLEGVFNRAGRA